MLRFPESLIILKSVIVFKSVDLARIDDFNRGTVGASPPPPSLAPTPVPFSGNLASQQMSLVDI
jgi:hypothetical protein